MVHAKEAYVCLSQITLCEVKLLRNIDFETDVLLPWHHQFFKNVLLFQQNPLYQPLDVCLYTHIFPIGLFQTIPSLLLVGTRDFQCEILIRGRGHGGLDCRASLYPVI